MYKLGNEPYYGSKSHRKLNYLTDSSLSEIQKILRQDYFSRLQKASLNHLINYVNEDEIISKTNKDIHSEEIHQKPIKYAAKQILFSNKVRKYNYNKIKRHPRNNTNNIRNINGSKTIPVSDEFTRDNSEDDKKDFIYKPKKVYKDKYPISYDINYIDEVEKKFIKPYLSKNNIIYKEYIPNKKSKTPFNFIIG